MPQHKSAKKRVRQNEKRRQHNRQLRSKMNTLVKKVFEAEDKDQAESRLREAISYLDKMTAKGIIHRNNAARKKAKITNHVNSL